MSRRAALLLLTAVVALASAAGVFAWFTAHGTAAATASVGRLNAPTDVNASATPGSGTVELSWTASSTTDGVAPEGYYVLRDDGSSPSAACGTSPTSLITDTSCNDNSVPDGTYSYLVIAKFHSWTAESAQSNTVTVVNDNAPPTTSIAFPTSGFHSAGDYNSGCSPAGVCGDSNDQSGVAVVRVSVKRVSDGFYWDGANFVSSASELFNDATLASPNAASTTWDLSLPLPADGGYTVHVQAKDTFGNDSTPADTSTRSFSIDTTPPTTTDDSASIGNSWTHTDQAVTLTPSDGGGSGVANTYYTSNGSAPTTGSSSGTSVALNGDGLYTVKYFSIDNVGNTETVKTASTQIRIDETNPNAGAVETSGAFVNAGTSYIRSGQALTDPTASDPSVNSASSGVASIAYYYCSGTCTPQPGQPGTTLIGSSGSSPYSVGFTQLTDGTYSILAEATDNAGNAASSSVKTVAVDNTKPSTSDNSATVGNDWKNSNQTVTLTPTDPVTNSIASGVANTYHTSNGSTPTTSSPSGTSVALNGDGIYTVKYFSVDNVGNTETVQTAGTQIRIDKTNPSAGAVVTAGAFVSGSTYIKNGQALTDTTASDPTVNGASSGVATIHYWRCSSGCNGTTPTSNPGVWTSIGTSSTASSYSVLWNGQPVDGTYSLIAGATDNAGNTAYSAIRTVVIDNTAPTTTANLSPAPNLVSWNKSNVSVTLSVNDGSGSGGASTSYSESGAQTVVNATYSTPFTISTEGTTTVTFHSADNLGNTESPDKVVTIKLDKTAPTVSIASITAGGVTTCEFISGSNAWYSNTNTGNSCGSGTTGNFTVTATATDPGVTASGINDVLFPTFTGFSGGGDVLAPGPYSAVYGWTTATTTSPSASVTASDVAGNTSTAGFAITRDNTAPTGTVTSPSAGSVSATISLASTSIADNGGGSGVRSLAYYRCSNVPASCATSPPGAAWTLIGSATTSPYNVSWDTTTVANGSYTLKGIMTDNVGNQSVTGAVGVTVANSYTFTVTDPSSPTSLTAGVADPNAITLQLQINGANTGTFNAATYAGSHTIAYGGTAMGAAPDGTLATPASSSVAFNASGQATIAASTLTFVKGGTGLSLSVTDATNSISGTSPGFTITAGAAARLAWTSFTNTSGTLSGICLFTCTYTGAGGSGTTFKSKIAVTDAHGNIVSNIGGAGISVTVTKSNGTITGSATVTIPAAGQALSSGGGDGTVAGEIRFTSENGNWATDTLSMTNTGAFANAAASFSK